MVIPRTNYDPNRDISEGDLVSIDWSDLVDVGIILKVAIIVRNDDHLVLSEEVLVAEVYVCGNIHVFDEDELTIVEKCKKQHLSV